MKTATSLHGFDALRYAAIVAVWLCFSCVQAAPGDLDSAFGGGKVVTMIGGAADVAYGVAVQADGKVVAAGYSDNGGNLDFGLIRHNANGTLDTGFGISGKVLTAFGAGSDVGQAVAIQGDGKIVVAGRTWNGTDHDIALARYHANGTLDASFGTGGKVITSVGGDDQGNSVAIQADGKIVVAGDSHNGTNADFTVVRYQSNGALDSSFGTGGKVTTGIGAGDDVAEGVMVQADGRIVIAGRSHNGGNDDFALLRYHPDGTLDGGFGIAGKVTTPISGGNDAATDVAIQTDGKIVAAGYANGDFALVRYHANGAIDSGFGTGGKATTSFGAGDDAASGLSVQGDGKIVVAGYSHNGANHDFALVRYRSNGTLDNGFGSGGKVITPVGTGSDQGYDVALQADGKIVVAGSSSAAGNFDFAVARYEGGDGNLIWNPSFEFVEGLGGGAPSEFADWAMDLTDIVTAENGITPSSGVRMGKFIGTGPLSGGPTVASELWQYVDLSAYSSLIAAGNLRITLTGRFNRVAGNSSTDTEFGLYVEPRSGTIAAGGTIGSQETTIFTDGNTSTWQLATNSLTIPAGTTHLLISIFARENVVNDSVLPEFAGHYVDDLQLTVRTDFTTLPAILALPARNSAVGDPLSVGFSLPEVPLAGSVKLAFTGAASRTLTLASGQGNQGGRVFSFSPSGPLASSAISGIAGGTNIPDGIYTVTLSYQDVLGNPVASVSSSNVTVDTTPPTLTAPADIVTGAASAAGAVVSFSPGATDNLDPAPALTANPASGSLFPIGVTNVDLTLTDAAGNVSNGSFSVTVQDRTSSPVFENATTVPLVTNGFDATDLTVGTVTLGFDPMPGQVLTLVNNTSANPMAGAFTDLPDGGTVLTSHGGRSLLFQAGYTGGDGNDVTLTLLDPEMIVEEPVGSDVPDGGSRFMPTVVTGSTSSLTFTIRNTGPGILNGLTISKSGADEQLFTVTQSPVAPLDGPAGSTTFAVEFSSPASGQKTVTLHIASDDADEHPFDIALTVRALSPSEDTDGDGLNDAAELRYASLGFDWQSSQPSLVGTLFGNANVAGLYNQAQYDGNRIAGRDDVTNDPNPFGLFTPDQVRSLNLPTPLIQRNPTTGGFTLTLGVEKSATLLPESFAPFPMTAPQTTINGEGKLEFRFTTPDDAAFFRLKAE